VDHRFKRCPGSLVGYRGRLNDRLNGWLPMSWSACTFNLFCATSAALTAAASPSAAAALLEREILPGTVVPIHYDLTLSPDLDALTFQGKVAITIQVNTSTSRITLNAVGITLDHTTVDGGQDATVTIDRKLGRQTLSFDAPVAAGRHELSIDYHGKIGRTTLGFFAMDYAGPDGARRTLATNFEPAAARELLPCWDEPGRKATFTIAIDAPKDRMAISNMPIAQVTDISPTRQRVRFAQTPKMSTYLLFVGVGDFERVHTNVDGTDVGVIVKRSDTTKAAYALQQAAALLHYYNGYFGVPFPLPKLDLIAAPGQIQGGSMENWGAIFCSQQHLLFDPQSSTEDDRQTVFLVVAHEMAHQWFGDLVTMAWWGDLWLNEGFARWMQTFAADELHPEWQTGLRAAAIFEAGKEADAMPSTHPVVQPVYTADQAEQAFDSITYDKGAAIISMLNAYAGRDKFRDGVRRYMQVHAYGNTVDSDLWRLIQDAVGKPIDGIEQDFTRQEGLPLVRVTRTATGVHLTQSRFAADPSTIAHLPPHRWRLPLAIGSIGGPAPYVLLHGSADVTRGAPVLVDAGRTAYARILYSANMLAALTAQLGALPAADQIGLMFDAHALGFAGYAPASNLLQLAAMLPAQANPVVWQRVIRMLKALDYRYRDSARRLIYRRFALALLSPLGVELGSGATPGETANVTILRSELQEDMGQFGDAAVIAHARQLLDSGGGTAGDQRSALSIVAAEADAATFDALLARAAKSTDPLEKGHVFEALATVEDPALAHRMLDIALSDQVPAGMATSLLYTLGRTHPDIAWEVVAPRLDEASLPLSQSERWLLAAFIAGGSADPQRVADLEAYEARNVPLEARKPFLGAVASIHDNQRIVKQILPEIDAWIAARQPSPSRASGARSSIHDHR
jgi:aminopeptidase N